MPAVTTDTDQRWLAEYVLPDQTVVRFRHLLPEDEPLLSRAFATASKDTLLHRFFSPVREVAPEVLRRMLQFDRARETCFVGIIQENGQPRIICGARYVRLANPQEAEVALTVHDQFQNKGLGRFMLELLARLAREKGIQTLEADVMSSNYRMIHLFQKVFPRHSEQYAGGDVLHFRINLE